VRKLGEHDAELLRRKSPLGRSKGKPESAPNAEGLKNAMVNFPMEATVIKLIMVIINDKLAPPPPLSWNSATTFRNEFEITDYA
jgi:hypothetical protein